MREKKEINVAVGRRIRRAREAAGLTQERFAELVGISPQNVSCVERGLAGVSMTVLRRMCEILRVSSDTLLLDAGATMRWRPLPSACGGYLRSNSGRYGRSSTGSWS